MDLSLATSRAVLPSYDKQVNTSPTHIDGSTTIYPKTEQSHQIRNIMVTNHPKKDEHNNQNSKNNNNNINNKLYIIIVVK